MLQQAESFQAIIPVRVSVSLIFPETLKISTRQININLKFL